MSAENSHWPTPRIPRCPTPSTPNCLHWTEEDWQAFDKWARSLSAYGPPPRNIGEKKRRAKSTVN